MKYLMCSNVQWCRFEMVCIFWNGAFTHPCNLQYKTYLLGCMNLKHYWPEQFDIKYQTSQFGHETHAFRL